MYAKITDGLVETYPYSVTQLRRDNKNVSFSREIPEETMNAFGMFAVEAVEAPAGDVVTEDAPEFVDGIWRQVWITRGFTDDERADHFAGLKAKKQKTINRDFEGEIAVLEDGYSSKERESWDAQTREAESYLTDAGATVPLLAAMAGARGLAEGDLAGRIVAKSVAWKQLYGVALGRKQSRKDSLIAVDISSAGAADAIIAI